MVNSLRTVFIVISCDTDPDRVGFLDGVPHGKLAWRGMTEGIPAVKELLHGLTDSTGREPTFTWLLRADEQIRELQGEYAWVVRTHSPLLRSLQQSGDELGWHPHFWRRDTTNGRWFQELEDADWQVEMLRQAHRDLATCFPGAVQSVRMGWAYHNNRTCAALDELGVTVDLSPLPGYRTLTPHPPTRSENLFDWYSSARKTGQVGQLWNAIRRPTYSINVTARPVFFAPLVTQLRTALRRTGNGPLVFSTQFHADELLPNRSRLYDFQGVRTNLESLLRACEESRTPVQFVQARQIYALLSD